MKICVYGLWHLGCVTAACLAEAGFDVMGLDPDPKVGSDLRSGNPPLFEPHLEDLIRSGVAAGRLSFSSDPSASRDADLIWVTFDTPVDDNDRADSNYVVRRIEEIFPHIKAGATVLISSQLPVGTTRRIEARFREKAPDRTCGFAYSPENLRLGQAIAAFRTPDRIVVGTRSDPARARLMALLGRFCNRLIWVSPESAEMSKHAINTWLATSVSLINEVATICELTGADAAEVEQALRSEPRIGPKAYVRAGGAFAGGTLARDVSFLTRIAAKRHVDLPLLESILPSNEKHRGWALRRLRDRLGDLSGKGVAVFGLAYKPGTDSLRRSTAVELCRLLLEAGVRVRAHDPHVQTAGADLADITLVTSPLETVRGADALVIVTEWPEFKDLPGREIVAQMRRPLVLDQNRFLEAMFRIDGVEYVTVGRPA